VDELGITTVNIGKQWKNLNGSEKEYIGSSNKCKKSNQPKMESVEFINRYEI